MNLNLSKIEEIPVRAIQGNTVLAMSVSNRELERCEKAIREYGLIHPMVVRRCEEGHYQVLAGECERMVLTRMRQSKVRAVVMEQIDAPEATRLALLLSSLKLSPNALSEGLLLKELCQSGKVTQTEIALMVGRSVSWVNKRLALAKRLVPSVVNLVKAGQLCPHSAQEIARLPGDVQQTFVGQVITEHLPKSAVERLVSTYNNPGTPREIRQSVLESPQTTLDWLSDAKESRSPIPKEDNEPKSLTFKKMRNILAMLYRLTGEAEGILVTLADEDKRFLSSTLKQCAQALERFIRLAKTDWKDYPFSPGKKASAEVEAHGH